MNADRIRMAIVGLGKMGLSHLAIANAHPHIDLVAVCDTNAFVLGSSRRFTSFQTYKDFARMIGEAGPEAIIVATPPTLHEEVTRTALANSIHVFCEKPFCIDADGGTRLSAEEASRRKLANQVGYHARFISTFREARRLIEAGALGLVPPHKGRSLRAVVLRPETGAWRGNRKSRGRLSVRLCESRR